MSRILLVDDDKRLLSLLERGFRFEGFDVLLATGGDAALALTRDEHPDVVVLDIGMPGIDGFEVHSDAPGTPGRAAARRHPRARGDGDTGAGIDPEDLPHIFERFYRGKNAAATSGTGLGLAIARWIAEQHGGRIEVESQRGRGSRFTVVLPLAASLLPDS